MKKNSFNYFPLILILFALLPACGGGNIGDVDNTHPSQSAPLNAPEIKVVRNENNQLIIDWPINHNADHYTLYISSSDGFEVNSTKTIQIKVPPFIIPSESDPKPYFFKVQANWGGNASPLSASEFSVSPPETPLLTSRITSLNSIELSWVEDENTRYTLYRDTGEILNPSNDSVIIDDISSPYEDMDIVAQETYQYWLVSIENEQSSAYSVRVSALSQGIVISGHVEDSNSGAALKPTTDIISVLPLNNQQNVDIASTSIVIVFSQEMLAQSINRDSFQVFDSESNLIDGNVSYDVLNRSALFSATDNWLKGVTYTVKLSTDIKSVANVPFTVEYTSAFTTELPTLTITDITVNENQLSATLTLILDSPSGAIVSLNYSTENNTATEPEDYTEQASSVDFAIGDLQKTIQLALSDDDIYELDESFYVNFSRVVGANLNDTKIEVTLADDESIPTLSVENISINEALPYVRLTAKLSHKTVLPVSVKFITRDDTAVSGIGLDFISKNDTINFAPLQLVETFDIQINQDQLSESSEIFSIVFSDVVGAVIDTATATVTISDNNGLPNIEASNVVIDESVGFVELTVVLSEASGQQISVDYESENGSAISGDDYTAVSGTLVFDAGEVSKTLSVIIIDDELSESDEAFSIKLSQAVNSTGQMAANIINDAFFIEISDGDMLPAVRVLNADVFEEDEKVILTVNLSAVSGQTISMEYATNNLTAISGVQEDYLTKKGSLVFAPNELSKTIEILLINDVIYEGEEKFSLELINIVNANLSVPEDSTATITIADNESLPSINLADISVREGDTAVAVVAILSHKSAFPVTVDYKSANVTAEAGSNLDYIAANGSLLIPALTTSQLLNLVIIQDDVSEPDEFFKLDLSNVQGASLARDSVKVTIIDANDLPSIEMLDVQVNETDAKAIVTVTLTPESAQTVTLNYATKNNSAIAGDNQDYALTQGGLEFPPGVTTATIEILLRDDSVYEGDEVFLLELSQLVNARFTKPLSNQANVTIKDSETLPVIIFDNASVNESAQTLTLDVSLSHKSIFPVSVNYNTSDMTARSGINQDYINTRGELTFLPGTIANFIDVKINTDAVSEETEIFNINFALNDTQGLYGILGGFVSEISIIDANKLPTVSVTKNVMSSESDAMVEVVVSLSEVSERRVTLDFSTTSVTATEGKGNDYLSNEGALTFLPNETIKTINVVLQNDDWYEGDESFSVDFGSLVNARFLTLKDKQALVLIKDDESVPVISFDDITVGEAVDMVNVGLTLLPRSTTAVSVDFSTLDDTAVAQLSGVSGDYVAKNGSIEFLPGSTNAKITLAVIDDVLFENSEKFLLSLFSPSQNVTLAKSQISISITDNDIKPSLSLADVIVNESLGTAKISVTLDKKSGVSTTLAYKTVNDTAISQKDFIPIVDGSLVFSAGETKQFIVVDIVDDTVAEMNEQFFIQTLSIDGAILANNQSLITIENDDATVSPVVTVVNDDRKLTINWPAVPAAENYDLYYAQEPGVLPGNYGAMGGTALANVSSGVSLTFPVDLKLWVDYYFIVTATLGNIESVPSAEIKVRTKMIPSKPLNDTGNVFGGNYPDGNNADCSGIAIGQQDCSNGRDAVFFDDSDGHAGFSYTKLDASGSKLPATATSWSCVLDNVTGLTWEVKTLGGFQRSSFTYTWYDSAAAYDTFESGIGDTGLLTTTNFITITGEVYPGSDNCGIETRCDTEKYAMDINNWNDGIGLCGVTDWRLPDIFELDSIKNYNSVSPAIDINYFPNTGNQFYWSSSPYTHYTTGNGTFLYAWAAGFEFGRKVSKFRADGYAVRLVRGGR